MTNMRDDPPFQPIRYTLYNSRDLLSGYDPTNPSSMGNTPDFLSYRYFVKNGRATPRDPYAGMLQALHDNSIGRAMHEFLSRVNRPAAAIMGGHGEDRGTPTYRNVVRIAKALTEEGFLMASGGGPGAMEATHLGALMAGKSDAEVEAAIVLLESQANLPATGSVVADDENATVDQRLVNLLHAWAKPAVELIGRYADGGQSLAVPTWYYGHEPFSPLASHVAKYFQNSIREDVLLALATNGIVYADGRAGTLQEVFQDAAQNYYRDKNEPFAPMVFFGKTFWEEKLPVETLLRALFITYKGMTEADFKAHVLFTDSIDEAVRFLVSHQPSTDKMMQRMLSLGFGPMLQALPS
jgi:hypothetical protein